MFNRFLKFIFTILFSLVCFVLVWLGYIRYEGNFHKINDELYRSGQLFDYNLPKYYKKYRFKTILNLRGKSNSKWYEYEKKFAKEHNITLIDFGISDRKIQNIETMQKIVDIIENAKKPILIHCKAGADRTGLASALYLYSIGDKRAESMLSLRYGHFPYLISKTKAMDKSFENYKLHFNR